jgi:hypothetical protein
MNKISSIHWVMDVVLTHKNTYSSRPVNWTQRCHGHS